jgi:hypothetical protein
VGDVPAPFRLADGWVSTSYGVKVPTRVIVLDGDVSLPVSFSYLFSDTRLDESARAHAMASLAAAGGHHASKGEPCVR